MKYMLAMYAAAVKVPQTAEGFRTAYPAFFTLSEELETAGVLTSNCGRSPVGDAAGGNGVG